MRQRSQHRRHQEPFGPGEPDAGALSGAEVRCTKLEAVSERGALDLRRGLSARPCGGGAAPAHEGVRGNHARGNLGRQVHADDGFVHRQAPIVAYGVPVELVVIGEELRHAIGFVTYDEAMIAGRERRPGREAQLRVTRGVSLLIRDRRAVFGGFQNLHANAGVCCVWTDEAAVPARFGIDGEFADHAVAEVIAFAMGNELLAHFERGVLAQRNVDGERKDAVRLCARAAAPGRVRARRFGRGAPDSARLAKHRRHPRVHEGSHDGESEDELQKTFEGLWHVGILSAGCWAECQMRL